MCSSAELCPEENAEEFVYLCREVLQFVRGNDLVAKEIANRYIELRFKRILLE